MPGTGAMNFFPRGVSKKIQYVGPQQLTLIRAVRSNNTPCGKRRARVLRYAGPAGVISPVKGYDNPTHVESQPGDPAVTGSETIIVIILHT